MQFVNKNIAVLGLGLETLDLIHWLTQHSQDSSITVFDQKTDSELKSELTQIKDLQSAKVFKTVNFSLGKDYLQSGLTAFDIIFRSPGFYRLHSAVIKAVKKNIPVSSSIKLFFQLCPCPIIGVTGTKGKGTTTALIHKILQSSGKSSYLAGNIGKSPLQLLSKLTKKDFVCLELSSFQLQDINQSPHIAVVLNITSEHLDVHKNTQEYRQAKANIINHQTVKDFTVLNADYSFSASLKNKTPASVFYFSRKKSVKGSYVENNKIYLNLNKSNKSILIGSTDKLLLRGQHNWENITAAITASALANADISAIQQAVFSFKGLEHRLELVKIINKISFYNDSFSTTPETTIAAIKSFTEPMIIILGGFDKKSDYTQLAQVIVNSQNIKAVILIGDMADKINQAINQAGSFKGKIIKDLTNMQQIINQTFTLSQANSVVILSPACASFDMFKNYKDRGNQFKHWVKKLV